MIAPKQEDNGKNLEAQCTKIKLQQRSTSVPKKKKNKGRIKRKPALDSHNTEMSFITFRKKDFIRENITMVGHTYARLMPMVHYILKKYTNHTKEHKISKAHAFLKRQEKPQVQKQFHVFLRQCCSNPHYYRLLKNYTEQLKAQASHMEKSDIVNLITNFRKDFKKKCHEQVKIVKKQQKKQWYPMKFHTNSHVHVPQTHPKTKQRSMKILKSAESHHTHQQIQYQSFDQVVQILRDVMPSIQSDLDDLKSVSLKPQFLSSLGFKSSQQMKQVMDMLDKNMEVITALSTVCNIQRTATDELAKQRSRVSKLVRLKTSYMKKVTHRKIVGEQITESAQNSCQGGNHSNADQINNAYQISNAVQINNADQISRVDHDDHGTQLMESDNQSVDSSDKQNHFKEFNFITSNIVADDHPKNQFSEHTLQQDTLVEEMRNHRQYVKLKPKLKNPVKNRPSIKQSQASSFLLLASTPMPLSSKTTAVETPQKASRTSSLVFPKINKEVKQQLDQPNSQADTQGFKQGDNLHQQSNQSDSVAQHGQSRRSNRNSSVRNSVKRESQSGHSNLQKTTRPSIVISIQQNQAPLQQMSRFRTARPSITIHQEQLPLSSQRQIKQKRPSTLNSPQSKPMDSILTFKATGGSQISEVKLQKKPKISDKFQVSSSCVILPAKIPQFNKLSINTRHNFVQNRTKIVQECQRMQQFLKSIKHSENFDVFIKRAQNNKLGTERRIPTSMYLKSRKDIIHEEYEHLEKLKLRKYKEYQQAINNFRKEYSKVQKSQQKLEKLNFFVKLFKLSLIKYRSADQDENIDIFLHDIIAKTAQPQLKDYLSLQKYQKGHIHKKRAAFEKALLDFSNNIRQMEQQALISQKQPSNKLIFYFNQ